MYCLNVHPGETLPEVIESLCGPVAAVKRAVSKDRPYDIGLRLGSLAADEAFLPARLSALKQTLDETNLRDCYMPCWSHLCIYGKTFKTVSLVVLNQSKLLSFWLLIRN